MANQAQMDRPNTHPGQGPTDSRPIGEAGKEVEIRRHLRLNDLNNPDQPPPGEPPMKGGGKAEGSAQRRFREETMEESTGKQAVYLLRRRDGDATEIPVLSAGEKEDAIIAFTIKEKVKLYLQAAKLDEQYEPVDLAPPALGALLRQARSEGVTLLAVDPHRQAQYQGEPQPVLLLQEIGDQTDANLYSEIQALRRG